MLHGYTLMHLQFPVFACRSASIPRSPRPRLTEAFFVPPSFRKHCYLICLEVFATATVTVQTGLVPQKHQFAAISTLRTRLLMVRKSDCLLGRTALLVMLYNVLR
jgi:hypothetical protein